MARAIYGVLFPYYQCGNCVFVLYIVDDIVHTHAYMYRPVVDVVVVIVVLLYTRVPSLL